MSIDQYEKFSYENNFLKFNSNINGFTEAVFKEFDKESDELFLKSKINDLLAGNVVNYTENLAHFILSIGRMVQNSIKILIN